MAAMLEQAKARAKIKFTVEVESETFAVTAFTEVIAHTEAVEDLDPETGQPRYFPRMKPGPTTYTFDGREITRGQFLALAERFQQDRDEWDARELRSRHPEWFTDSAP